MDKLSLHHGHHGCAIPPPEKGERRCEYTVELLKSIRAEVNWDVELDVYVFLQRFDDEISGHWPCRACPYPNLRDIFSREEIELLLAESARSNHEFFKTERFIAFAIECGYRDELPELERDGSSNVIRRATPIHRAAAFTGPDAGEIIDRLFRIYDRYDASYVDETGLTHLHVACGAGLNHVVDKYLRAGRVDPSEAWPGTGDTPLHLACRHENEPMARALLLAGADPNARTASGQTPLHVICNLPSVAASRGMARLLFGCCKATQRRVQVDARDRFGNPPLFAAIFQGRRRLIGRLLREGADPTATNLDGWTPLHIVCQRQSDDKLVDEFFDLVEMEAPPGTTVLSVDARDKQGRTPLQWAVVHCRPNAVEALLQRGADLANFVYPSEEHFAARTGPWSQWANLPLTLACGLLRVLEKLEKRDYRLDRDAALTVMNVLARNGFFEKSLPRHDEVDRVEREWFADISENMMITTRLSLADLLELSIDEAAKRLSLSQCWQVARWSIFEYTSSSGGGPIDRCLKRMHEITARGFFRRCALYPFWDLIHCRLPIEICEMVIQDLTNEDLYHICVAAKGLSSR